MKQATAVFWVLHLLLNALLGVLFYQWLGIPDQKLWQVGVTVLSGIFLLLCLLWLHSATFAYFGSDVELGGAWRLGLRRLPLFALWAIACAVVLSVTAQWPFVWLVVVAVLLPLAGAAVNGLPIAWAAYRHWWYWAAALLLLLVGIYLPLKLVGWVPSVSGFTLQAASFAVRVGVGYLLFVTAWVMLAYVSVGGKPRTAQPSTVAFP